jgi:predicted NUDIX family NTP pyrophosphohydrolase
MREFTEETRMQAVRPFEELGTVRQESGKIVHAWGFEGDCDLAMVRSNTFVMEWPLHSGKEADFLEVDRAAFFSIVDAKEKMHPVKFDFFIALIKFLAAGIKPVEIMEQYTPFGQTRRNF